MSAPKNAAQAPESSPSKPLNLADFEKRVKRLEEITERLKSDELPLGDVLESFERGMAIEREADKILTQAEQQIQALTEAAKEAETGTQLKGSLNDSPPDSSPADFEKRIKALEEIADRLDSDELPLADVLKDFERGMKLAREADAILSKAEQKISRLTQTDKGEALKEEAQEEAEEESGAAS